MVWNLELKSGLKPLLTLDQGIDVLAPGTGESGQEEPRVE